MNTQKISYLTLGITLINTALIGVVLFFQFVFRPGEQRFTSETAPFETKKEASECAERFRTADSLNIPLALRFSSKDLIALTDDKKKPYVRFYFGVNLKNKNLTLIAVGVDQKNVDDDALHSQDGHMVTKMYEFADPCPKCMIDGVSHDHGTSNQLNKVLYPEENSDGTPVQPFYTFYSKKVCLK